MYRCRSRLAAAARASHSEVVGSVGLRRQGALEQLQLPAHASAAPSASQRHRRSPFGSARGRHRSDRPTGLGQLFAAGTIAVAARVIVPPAARRQAASLAHVDGQQGRCASARCHSPCPRPTAAVPQRPRRPCRAPARSVDTRSVSRGRRFDSRFFATASRWRAGTSRVALRQHRRRGSPASAAARAARRPRRGQSRTPPGTAPTRRAAWSVDAHQLSASVQKAGVDVRPHRLALCGAGRRSLPDTRVGFLLSLTVSRSAGRLGERVGIVHDSSHVNGLVRPAGTVRTI